MLLCRRERVSCQIEKTERECFLTATRLFFLNRGCYNLCTTNTTLNAERDGDAVPKRDAACRAAGLNPAVPLPRPAPWETVTTTSAAAAPTAAPTGASPSPAPSNNATTQGNKNAAVGMNAATGLVGVAAAGLVGVMALVL